MKPRTKIGAFLCSWHLHWWKVRSYRRCRRCGQCQTLYEPGGWEDCNLEAPDAIYKRKEKK